MPDPDAILRQVGRDTLVQALARRLTAVGAEVAPDKAALLQAHYVVTYLLPSEHVQWLRRILVELS